MKHLITLLFMVGAVKASCQEPSDSASWDAEMEDSVCAMSIKPVEHPEELLRRAMERFEMDIRQKHSRRDYKVEAIFNIRTPPPLYVDRISGRRR